MVTETKLKDGLLTLGEAPDQLDASCQPTNIRITPAHAESGDALETLCGDVLPADTTRSDTLNMTAIQDFSDPAGLQAYSWEHDLEWVPFVWRPRGAANPGYGGEVQVRAMEIGGDVNKRISTDVAWPLRDVVPLPAP